MQNTLIRFTSSEYVDSYLKGDLYLSSLSSFWDFTKGLIDQAEIKNRNISIETIKKAEEYRKIKQQDFSEGVIAQIPRSELAAFFGDMKDHIIHDVRFRLSAYKYCNLLCFFRIDADDGMSFPMDVDNCAEILRQHGKHITEAELQMMSPSAALKMVNSVLPSNVLLSEHSCHAVQLPALEMDKFGDAVVIIKDENEFCRRVISAVKKLNGHCILGDVRYHPLLDRDDSSSMKRHAVTIISSKAGQDVPRANYRVTEDGSFDMSILNGLKKILWRGCLDKYDIYSFQKEWRVCWLPVERNYEAKILSVGRLDDIIEIVQTKHIREWLLDKYKGYIPGFIKKTRKSIRGTETYKEFRDRVQAIGGNGEFIMEIG